jgi:hypothetical protein
MRHLNHLLVYINFFPLCVLAKGRVGIVIKVWEFGSNLRELGI